MNRDLQQSGITRSRIESPGLHDLFMICWSLVILLIIKFLMILLGDVAALFLGSFPGTIQNLNIDG